jgi:succinoglycan biosynthesis transport protein ExoP
MELKQYLQIVRKWLWLIVLGTSLAAGISYGVSSLLPPTYRASTSLLIRAAGASSDYSTILASERLAATYRELLVKRPVIETTVRRLNLDSSRIKDLLGKNRVEARIVPNTSVIVLTVDDNDPLLAMKIANEITEVFMETLRQMGGGRGRDVFVIEPASQPLEPTSPRKLFNTLIAAGGGLTLAVGAAFFIEYLDDTMQTIEDVHRTLSLPTLANIPRPERRQKQGEKPVAVISPNSSMTEAYRSLRTSLQFSNGNALLRAMQITSPRPLERRANVAANLAAVTAQVGLKVILVDADLRCPGLHRSFQVSNEMGLTMVLSKEVELQECVVETGVSNLRLLPAGPSVPNPSEILASKRMRQLVEELKQHADVVLLTAPPVLAVTDATVLATLLDGTVLVIESRSTPREAAVRAVETLRSADAKFLGVVLDRVNSTRHGYR